MEMDMKIQVEAKVLIPDVPKEIKFTNGQSMPIESLSENALMKIGKQWTKNLVLAAHPDSTIGQEKPAPEKPENPEPVEGKKPNGKKK